MKRFAALAVALSLALAACQAPAGPEEVSPPPLSGSPAPGPESSTVQGPTPGETSEPEPVLTPAPGVEVKTLFTWEPGSRRVEVPFPVRDERLLVETHTQTGQWTETGLAGFDLATGEEFTAPLAKFDGFECRQVLDSPGWEIKIFSETSYQRLSWTQSLDDYTLPESLWEGRRTYSGKYDWDAQPEKDLLTWTSPEGLWLAAADGSGARLVLTAGDVLKQPDFAFLAEKNRNLPVEAALTFQCPRLMNGGKNIVVDFDLPGSPTGHIGLAVLNLATGRAAWYDPFANPLWGGLEYLDDTTVQAGFLQINVVTGEAREVSRHIQTGEPYFVATTGDFSRYFACDAEEGLAVLSPEGGREPETVLTATGYRKLSLCHAIDACRVVCEYEKPGEAGLLLVTVPEPPPPEPVPDPVLTVSPGVDCKTLLTWDGAEKEISLGPRCLENKQLLLETAGDKRKALGLDLETGVIDFTLPLEEDSCLREVLGEPGEFLVMGRTGCRHYVWREDGWLGEYPAYNLPEQAREAIKGYERDEYCCRFFWDVLPGKNLLAWTAADGVWLAEADGSNARLAISAKEVFENPDFDDVRAEYPYLFSDPNPGSEYGPLLVEPCFMDGGKKLTAVEYLLNPIINHGDCYNLNVLDIPSGMTARYNLGVSFWQIEYLDERTILVNGANTKLNVHDGTTEIFELKHCYIYPKGWGFSADGTHFFTSYNTSETSQLIRYSLDGSNNDYGFFDKKIEAGQAKILLDLENSYVHGETPVNGNQVLCFWAPFTTSPDQTTRLLLVTAPD